MLAFFSVPAACIARSAATITAIPPLSSPAPGPCAWSPCGTQRWNGESGSNTVSRCAISSSRLPRLAARVARDEVAGAARRLHVDPFGLEAELLELRLDHVAAPHRRRRCSSSRCSGRPSARAAPSVRCCSASTVRIMDLLGAAERGGGGRLRQRRKRQRQRNEIMGSCGVHRRQALAAAFEVRVATDRLRWFT